MRFSPVRSPAPRLVCACALFFALSLVVGACGEKERVSGASKQERVLRVSGSGSASDLLEKLAVGYRREAPNVRLNFLEGTDSAGGIAAVGERVIEVGAVSRAPKAGELARGVVYRRFATDAAAFVGNGGGVRSLTRGQLKRAFAGRVTNWRELGGSDMPIVVLVRDEDESVTQVLRRDLFGEDFRFARGAIVLSSTDDINAALAKTRGALGFTSYGSLVSDGAKLKALAVESVGPSVEALERGDYPFRRPLGLAFRPAVETTRLTAYLGSDAAAGQLAELGYAVSP